ncbi:geranylgeranylglycerol-phosphate geranylgeranyltransferase [Flavobacterium sp. J49]|uniref:geranylgeranylglycerol-phosphate geranylgeranyltransferase n=1 Tax=Flavobacterium sp. J49 TaxID=2718534 RepID=UPI001593C667|nr:geranylgeranylglycerol-phosphate geranylgeranyltransferase [Flavobacterium sp. J49]MBF6640822.1 geranylgeranylglycerol-phosphate geranylgeranyltransferase [Flavobacterium sp. J49]NIC02069.1 UbiA family prenyltransferase [Flavobacterium sp. J49]
MNFLKLIRYQNLLLLAFMQLIFRYGFLKHEAIYLFLNDFQYGLLVLSTMMIAGAGYIINDVMDQETDSENKPFKMVIGKGISEAMAYNIYFALNVTGVGIGFYLSNTIQKPTFAGIFIIIVTLLYLYATTFKRMLLIGNLIVAFLLAISILIIGVYDLLPLTFESNQKEMGVYFSLLLDYALFAFLINFIREIVKDMEDVNGDYNQGMNTLPIALGIGRTAKVVFGLGITVTLILLWYINTYLMENQLYYAVIYALLFVVGPMIFFVIRIWNAKSKKNFHLLSSVLKWIIFFGIMSILVINLNIKNNA